MSGHIYIYIYIYIYRYYIAAEDAQENDEYARTYWWSTANIARASTCNSDYINCDYLGNQRD